MSTFKAKIFAYSDEGRGDGDDVTKLGQLSGIKRSFLNHEVPVSWGKRVRATIPFAYLFLYIQYNSFFFFALLLSFPSFLFGDDDDDNDDNDADITTMMGFIYTVPDFIHSFTFE